MTRGSVVNSSARFLDLCRQTARLVYVCLGGFYLMGVAGAADQRLSGSTALSRQLQELQKDMTINPISLWLDRGQTLWLGQCQSCHGEIKTLKTSAATFPRLAQDGKTLLNLEDQVVRCQQRNASSVQSGISAVNRLESEPVLALSAVLHQAAAGEQINVSSSSKAQEVQWQARLLDGERLYNTRMGRMNLACMHCHDQKVGAQMRADTITQGHPTGFPIYRMSWQSLGSIDRRLRACYSGVQAPVPPAGSPELRDLELYLKVRAKDMALDGPSIRR